MSTKANLLSNTEAIHTRRDKEKLSDIAKCRYFIFMQNGNAFQFNRE